MLRFDEERRIIVKDEKSEKFQKECEQTILDEDTLNLRKKIENDIYEKVKNAGISEDNIEEIVEKIINKTDIDLESLDAEKLVFLNLNKTELAVIKDGIQEALDEVRINKETGEVLYVPPKIIKLLHFIENNKTTINMAQLALYLSPFAISALNSLVENDFQSVKNLNKHFSKELTDFCKDTQNSPNKEAGHGDLEESKAEANKYFNYAELIKNGEKEDIDSLMDNVKASDPDVILFGEYHGPDSNAIDATKVLEKLQSEDHKIAKIAFEFISYKDPAAAKAVEQFNNKEISTEDFYGSGQVYARSDIRPILEFAQSHNIPITGVESESYDFDGKDLSRFTEISHKVGELASKNTGKGITAVFIGERHTTASNFNLDDPTASVYKEGRANLAQGDYTIKEFLEKEGFKPVAINLYNEQEFARASDEYFEKSYENLDEKNASEFGEYCLQNWGKYQSNQKASFAVSHGNEKNVYSLVSPGKITEVPPLLNAVKEINDNHPFLKELIQKQNVYMNVDQQAITLEYDGKNAELVKIDSETGRIKEIFMPAQEEDIRENSQGYVLAAELEKEFEHYYDHELYKREHKINLNKAAYEEMQKQREVRRAGIEKVVNSENLSFEIAKEEQKETDSLLEKIRGKIRNFGGKKEE